MSLYTEAECLRCTNKWIKHVEEPKTCPRCKSPYWNKERVGHGFAKRGDARVQYPWPLMELNEIVTIPLTRTPDGLWLDDRENTRRAASLDRFITRSGKRFYVHMQGLNMVIKRIL